jgi:TPP-dependent pyruvate/acetoin dehydrogenase alpha subunit
MPASAPRFPGPMAAIRALSPSVPAPVPAPGGFTRDQLLQLYYYMALIRALEEQLVALYRQSKLYGGLFRSLGREADAVGSAYALDRARGDVFSPLIRAPVRRVAAHDVPLPAAPGLEDFVLPQTGDIVVAARWLAAY